jgi:predicted  nucleic acid-binding Zn-ribbon protein
MLSPDDTSRNPAANEHRSFDFRSALSGRRRSILRQKQSERETESLPTVKKNTAEQAKGAGRQVVQLRDENKRLRSELAELRGEMQRLVAEHTAMQGHFEREVSVIHSGHLQELEQTQRHLQEVTKERNRFQESYRKMEHRYQELYSNFQVALEEETEKMLSEAAQTLIISPENAPAVLRGAVKTIELQVRQDEDQQLGAAHGLKDEFRRITSRLEQEQSALEEERQTLLRMQNSAREQAELRHKTLQERLRARWTTALAFLTTGVLVLLVVLQYLFLFLLRVRISNTISIALLAPIVLCVLLAIVFSRPFATMRHFYKSAPQKKKVQ